MTEAAVHPQFESSTSCVDGKLVDQYLAELIHSVNYQCSLCDKVHVEVARLEEQVKAAYASTARSLRGVYDMKEIANRWLAMVYLAADAVQTATVASDAHQICGVDVSKLREFYEEALERFKAHCPAVVCP